jgi:hypothetical protein
MSVTATCGHTLTEEEHLGTTISVKDYSRDGSKAIGHPTLCNKCLKWYEKSDLYLRTEEERLTWLKK